jgi:hypothetical protein
MKFLSQAHRGFSFMIEGAKMMAQNWWVGGAALLELHLDQPSGRSPLVHPVHHPILRFCGVHIMPRGSSRRS